ncbi:GNAT superfamily N-acetyltransferase [Frigoribacterium sp. PvP120]|uniref:GNAT family N-acetyltransferase n=1 Tax=unclassified Frigoribacterium TaxID=2627005 RepID=UPI001AE86CE9|nr:GNAT family N-acetyltransferase [Frigoribacterium sp. PvP121]MBP1239832.1 GNAT superfamily N-acetyltransferase [Frigoribacterium sp. PvP121]
MTDPAVPTPASARPLREVVTEWVEGWTASRGVVAVERDGSWRVPFGHPDRWAEFVVPLDGGPGAGDATAGSSSAASRTARTEQLAAVLAEAAEVGRLGDRVWVTVVGHDPEAVVAAGRRSGFEVRSAEESLMGIALDQQAVREVPAPYELDVQEVGAAVGAARVTADAPAPVLRATAWVGEGHPGEGDDAATGRAALTPAGTAVLDRVETDDEHRRRGLGGAVVHALVAESRRRGATRGLLVASVDGALLYGSLGWGPLASVVILVTPAVR